MAESAPFSHFVFTLSSAGQSLRLGLSRPVVMGILNATPDSFSDGGKFLNLNAAVDHIGQMVTDGATIVDIGGESTRPGSDPVSEAEEIDRTQSVVEIAAKHFPETLISIDTTKFGVAEKALKAGAHIINDVSGLAKEPRFVELAVQFNAGLVIMHSQGDPKTMQKNPTYADVVQEVGGFLENQASHARKAGVSCVITDPGIGFGKTLEHNLKLIAGLKKISDLPFPVLVGASRKSMIPKITGRPAIDDRLSGTLAIHYHCLINGAKILRVHDVKEAIDSVMIYNAISEFSP